MGPISRSATIVAATMALLAAGCQGQAAEVPGDVEVSETEPHDVETDDHGEHEGDSSAGASEG